MHKRNEDVRDSENCMIKIEYVKIEFQAVRSSRHQDNLYRYDFVF